MSRVGEFFEREAGRYARKPMGFRPRHRLIAARIDASLSGKVASIGGPWLETTYPTRARITLFDLSFAMLARWSADPVTRVVADAAAPPLRPSSLDHVVFPLILHHLTGRSAAQARSMIRSSIAAVFEALRPGGTVWISEFSISTPVYLAQNAAAPITRMMLGMKGIPLVLMHPGAVYHSMLEETGFADVRVEKIRPDHDSPLDLVQPVIGLPWLVVPKGLYPVDNILVTAKKPGGEGPTRE